MNLPAIQRRPRIFIIGGGISGLAAAHRVVEETRRRNISVDVRLFDSSDRLGGVIHTVQQEEFLLEGGPDSFITEKPWGLDLCRRIGIEPQLIGTSETHRRTFIVREGRLLPIPDGFYLMAPTKIWPVVSTPIFSWAGKIRMAADLVLPRKMVAHGGEDESLANFVRRRLGREALERMAQPLIGGIYTSDPEELSLQATMPRFLEMEKHHRSLILAMLQQRKKLSSNNHSQASGPRYGLFVSLGQGMKVLTQSLEKKLPAGSIELNAEVVSLGWNPSQKLWGVRLGNGKEMEAEAVCLALPAYRSGKLLEGVDQQISNKLKMIRYASTATVNLAYRREDIRQSIDGFGFVIPAIEGREMLACTFSHVKFSGRAPKEFALLRVFMGGALQPKVFEYEDTELLRVIQRNLKELLGIVANPIFLRIERHPLSMAQYHVGHLDLVADIESRMEKFPTLQLAGNAFTGIGIPDCIHRGERCADKLISQLRGESESEQSLQLHLF
jgi:oxygen-dependent protoporphyrinogen oxidase